MVWTMLADPQMPEQLDATSCWLTVAKTVLEKLGIAVPSLEALRKQYAGNSTEKMGSQSALIGTGDTLKVLSDYGVKTTKKTKEDERREAGNLMKWISVYISGGVPVVGGIRFGQYAGGHAIMVCGYNDTFAEIMFSDPATGAMKAVKLEKLLSGNFRYRKAPRQNKKGEKVYGMPDAWAYMSYLAFPIPPAKYIKAK